MKIKLLSFFFLLLLTGGLAAQEYSNTEEPTGFSTLSEAAQMADEIVQAAGVKANFVIAEARVPNAVAVVHQGKRYILYNPNFITALTKATGTRWSAVSVLAHEIGHHLYNKSLKKGQAVMATELEADEFSGYVLEKMGASLAEAQAAMKVLATTQATRTHPARIDRISSIAAGWKNAGGTIGEDEDPEQHTEATYPGTLPRSTALPTGHIAATIYFDATPDASFYVTTGLYVVKIGNDKIWRVGRLTRSNSRYYPYILYDDTGYRLYVDVYGQIFSGAGKMVGKMKAGAA